MGFIMLEGTAYHAFLFDDILISVIFSAFSRHEMRVPGEVVYSVLTIADNMLLSIMNAHIFTQQQQRSNRSTTADNTRGRWVNVISHHAARKCTACTRRDI
jgi:hypothetical protein